jgi:hypothetical protein
MNRLAECDAAHAGRGDLQSVDDGAVGFPGLFAGAGFALS